MNSAGRHFSLPALFIHFSLLVWPHAGVLPSLWIFIHLASVYPTDANTYIHMYFHMYSHFLLFSHSYVCIFCCFPIHIFTFSAVFPYTYIHSYIFYIFTYIHSYIFCCFPIHFESVYPHFSYIIPADWNKCMPNPSILKSSVRKTFCSARSFSSEALSIDCKDLNWGLGFRV